MRRILILIFAGAILALAQTASSPKPNATQIAQQFGPAFHPLSGFPVLTGDLDKDGAEDAVVVATAENPLLDQAQYHFKVIDPYSSSFGLGDPSITQQFSVKADVSRYLLIVHNWRAPKAKFVVINFPFDKLSIDRVFVKKKVYPAIRGEESTGSKSVVYWDGRKWKWKDEGLE